MPNATHPAYLCQCQAPRPRIELGEDSGLCAVCNLIYDERLYEMRLAQHEVNWHYESIDAYLRVVSPHYRQLVGA